MTAAPSAAPDVFLLYSSADQLFGGMVGRDLSSAGFSVADRPAGTRAGQDWVAEIAGLLEHVAALVLLITPDAVRSESVRQAVDVALRLSKPIVPILQRDVPREQLPPEWSSLQPIDFRDGVDTYRALAQLIETLRRTSGTPPPASASTTSGSVNLSRSPLKLSVNGTDVIVILSLLSDGQTVPELVSATQELAQLLARAARINRRANDSVDLSFSSMLIAFLASDDPLSRWFQGYVRDASIPMDVLLAARQLDQATLDQIAAQPVSDDELAPTWLRSRSATALLASAQRFCNATSGGPVDVRHLLATYLYRPAGHERDLIDFGFNRVAWSNAFLNWIAGAYPAELETWKSLHIEVFPNTTPVILRDGLSTHITTDLWTVEDTLGYRAYAYAISRFMTHPKTCPPLTISIQAPWGGGKTSLMRMIQRELDPQAPGLPGSTPPPATAQTPARRVGLTIRQVLDEVDSWFRLGVGSSGDERVVPGDGAARTSGAVEPSGKALPQVPAEQIANLLTIWFNAWKYESVNQVWSGLVDAVMHQVAARLSPADRELFWLRLNLRRIDADTIRRTIYERVLSYWWRMMRVWVFGLLGAVGLALLMALVGWISNWRGLQQVGWGGLGLSLLGSAGLAVFKYWQANRTVKSEPAAISLSQYLNIPDYNKELGFIHQTEADMRRVLQCVPRRPDGSPRPIVIFIDDLDRCSPAKVGDVMEAINLFLAGEFPDCMFVLGMDSEMVAAALQAAHKPMIDQLPPDAGIPVGWRFMDKFVQLPFMIPPAVPTDLTRYTAALFALEQRRDPQVEALARQAAERITDRSAASRVVRQLQQEHQLSETQVGRLQDRVEAQVVQREIDAGIARYTDDNPEVRGAIAAATTYFCGNPRDLKRFINAFRFHYFLWLARRSQTQDAPTLDQLLRWVVLSMKWPEVVRWLRRSGGSEWQIAADGDGSNGAGQVAPSRLRLIEEISGAAKNLADWQKLAQERLRLEPRSAPWLCDDDLLEFFHHEHTDFSAGQRLSDGAGKGAW